MTGRWQQLERDLDERDEQGRWPHRVLGERGHCSKARLIVRHRRSGVESSTFCCSINSVLISAQVNLVAEITSAPMPPPSFDSARGSTTAVTVAAAFVALAVILMALAGLGSRWGWWYFTTGFELLKWAAYAAIAAAMVTVAAALLVRGAHRSRSFIIAAVAVATAFGIVSVPWRMLRAARALPPIHDITTDTNDPPAFVALHDRRPGAINPVEYGGPAVAAQQHAGYPDIASVILNVSATQALERAATVAHQLGWTIVVLDTVAGRMESSDRTPWFGFTDDQVVRVRPTPAGSRVDIRSLSRVGGSDVGTNARRIRAFLAAIEGR